MNKNLCVCVCILCNVDVDANIFHEEEKEIEQQNEITCICLFVIRINPLLLVFLCQVCVYQKCYITFFMFYFLLLKQEMFQVIKKKARDIERERKIYIYTYYNETIWIWILLYSCFVCCYIIL
jgi:hypothetical protein